MSAPLLSKYELHTADRLIHHRGKRGGKGGGEAWCRDTERTKRNVQKKEKERGRVGRREVGGIGSRWKEDERKESVLGEMSGRKR